MDETFLCEEVNSQAYPAKIDIVFSCHIAALTISVFRLKNICVLIDFKTRTGLGEESI